MIKLSQEIAQTSAEFQKRYQKTTTGPDFKNCPSFCLLYNPRIMQCMSGGSVEVCIMEKENKFRFSYLLSILQICPEIDSNCKVVLELDQKGDTQDISVCKDHI